MYAFAQEVNVQFERLRIPKQLNKENIMGIIQKSAFLT